MNNKCIRSYFNTLTDEEKSKLFNERGYNNVLFRLPTKTISKEDIVKKINDWRNGKVNIDGLDDDYNDYLAIYLDDNDINTFVIDSETNEELDDFTREYENANYTVQKNLGLSDAEMDRIFG